MIAEVLLVLTAPFNALGLIYVLRGFRHHDLEARNRADGMFAIVDAILAVYFTLQGQRFLAGLFAALAVWLAWEWWRKRKRRDPAARSLGAKSRARLAALVAKVRESAKPRRVLRPVPGGAS